MQLTYTVFSSASAFFLTSTFTVSPSKLMSPVTQSSQPAGTFLRRLVLKELAPAATLISSIAFSRGIFVSSSMQLTQIVFVSASTILRTLTLIVSFAQLMSPVSTSSYPSGTFSRRLELKLDAPSGTSTCSISAPSTGTPFSSMQLTQIVFVAASTILRTLTLIVSFAQLMSPVSTSSYPSGTFSRRLELKLDAPSGTSTCSISAPSTGTPFSSMQLTQIVFVAASTILRTLTLIVSFAQLMSPVSTSSYPSGTFSRRLELKLDAPSGTSTCSISAPSTGTPFSSMQLTQIVFVAAATSASNLSEVSATAGVSTASNSTSSKSFSSSSSSASASVVSSTTSSVSASVVSSTTSSVSASVVSSTTSSVSASVVSSTTSSVSVTSSSGASVVSSSAVCSLIIEETSSAAIATDALLHKREPTVIAVTTLTPNFFLYINTPPRFFLVGGIIY